MGLFGRKKSHESAKRTTPAENWQPNVDLAVARPLVFEMIYTSHTPAIGSDAIEDVVHKFGRASGTPIEPMALMEYDPEVYDYRAILQRPWMWLAAVAETAAASGDHHLVAACAFWAHHWTNVMQPDFGAYERQFWLVGSVPDDVRRTLRDVGMESLSLLPDDFVLFGDDTGEVRAGGLRRALPAMLA